MAELLRYCIEEVPFQLYQCTAPHQRRQWRYKAPKCEFYVCDANGQRPVYKWAQTRDFYNAGYEMPPTLQRLLDRLNSDFQLQGENVLNHVMIIVNEQSGSTSGTAHEAPPHADKIKTGRFFDVSLGYAREFQLISEDGTVVSQRLASGSLAYISETDNGHGPKNEDARYKHAVPIDPHQPRDQPRFSIVARAIVPRSDGRDTDEHFRPVDDAAAARVQPGGDLWKEYVPLCRRSDGDAMEVEGDGEESEEGARQAAEQ
eukprot:7380836-Prymnesium_polylepis.1